MSLSDLDSYGKYNANGATTTFAIAHAIVEDDSDEVKVYVIDESVYPFVATLQVEGALNDYTLTGASPPTTPFATTVTFNSAPANGLKVLVCRTMLANQLQDLDIATNVPLNTMELMVDRATALIQMLFRSTERTPKYPESYTTVKHPSLEPPTTAGACLIVNDDLDGYIEGPTASAIGSAAADAAAAAASAAAAAASAAAAALSAASAALAAGTVAVDEFTGDGSDTTFALSVTPTTENQCLVAIDGAVQPKSTFSIATNVITFSEAPLNGSLIEVTTFSALPITAMEANAAASAAAAAASEAAALTAETNAETAETNAETAQAAAEAARDAAQTAETNAETAETNAETAETNAETARDAAVVAQGLAEDARDDAQAAAALAVGVLVPTGTRAAPSAIVAGTGIAFTGGSARQIWYIEGSGGAVDISANPQIAAGVTVNQELILMGRNDTNTVLLEDGTGLQLNGPCTLGAGGVLNLIWDGTNWVETSRSL